MTRRWALALSAVAAVSLAACESDSATSVGPRGQEAFTRYVAMGTSVSMGVSDGDNAVVYFNQVNSWPALLARQAGNTNFTQPLMRSPGCFPPLIAPLALGRNLRGASIATTDTTCAGPLPGFPNPANAPYNNTAISGALTTYALNYTPEITAQGGIGANPNTSAVFRRKMYPLVLPSGMTQVTAMLAQDPTFVSVEFGANEVLGTLTNGMLIPGATYVPYEAWEPEYTKIIDSVKSTGAKAVLTTVPRVSRWISLVAGSELYADRAALQNYGVIVAADCDGSQNRIFVVSKVLGLVARARALNAPQTLTCTNNLPAPPTPDYVLTPDDIATVNGLVDQMNTRIAALAAENGYALVDVDAALEEALAITLARRPTFSVTKMLTCTLPFGPVWGLDGVHPSHAGYRLVANYAIRAINQQYDFTLQEVALDLPTESGACAETDPTLARR